MRTRRAVGPTLLVLAMLGPAAADDQDGAAEADRRFDAMLEKAKADPEKADWKALRHAFAATSRYEPYNVEWRKEIAAVGMALESGDTKRAEEGLVKLMDREGYMRIDAHGLAVALYDKTGQKDKAALHRQFVEGIAGTLFVPGTGQSFAKPIEVLFIEEEYLFLGTLDVKAERQGLQEHDGHRFDVFEAVAGPDGEPKTYYFNVDLPQGALGRMLRRSGAAPKRG